MRSSLRRAGVWSIAVALCACGPGGSSASGNKTGSVTVVSAVATVSGMTYAGTIFSASFNEAQSTDGTQCATRAAGPCQIRECTINADAGATNPARSAGTVSFMGAGESLSLQPSADGTYAGDAPRNEIFPAGTEVTVSAGGDAVPAFTTTVRVPARVEITAPMLSLATTTNISRAMPLATSWTGGTSGKVLVFLASASASRSATVSCTYDATAGSATIAADVLSALPVGSGSIAIGGVEQREVTAGGYTVTVSASGVALIGGAAPAMYQ